MNVGQPETYITTEMHAAIGREMSHVVSFPVAESDIRRWAVAVYYPEQPPRRFWDATSAAGMRDGGIVAPEDFNPFAWMTSDGPSSGAVDDLDGIEALLGIEGPGLKNVLNGGVSTEYGVPIRPGDVITAVTRLREYRERPGSLGLMLFTISETVWTNQRSETVRTSSATIIRY